MSEKEPLNPSVYISQIAHTEAYRAGKARMDTLKGHVPESQIINTRRLAINMGAASLTVEEKSGYMSRESHIFKVISLIDSFARSSEQLGKLRAIQAPRKDLEPYLKEVISFNHAIKGLVDNDPSLKFNDVVLFARQMYAVINGTEKSQMFSNAVNESLSGMRHELGFEQIIGTMPDVEYEEATESDDLGGIDINVHIGNTWAPIDVKASELTAANAQRKSRNPNLIMWSRLNDQDFRGGFRVDPTLALDKAQDVRPLLKKAARSLSVSA